LQEVEGGIAFRLFEKEYYLTWRNLISHLGFSTKCSFDLDHALRGFNRHEFWRMSSSQNVVGKFQPQNMNIHHPTLRFMHWWIAMTLFARQDIKSVYHVEMQILYAILKKIKIAPVKEIFKHLLETFKASTSISCTSLVTRIATNIGALDGQDVTYISTPRIDINEHYLMQGHHLKYDDAGNLVFFSRGTQMRYRSLTRDSLCINLHHSPSLLSNKRKHAGVLSLIGEQEAGLGTKLAALNNHRH